MADIIVTGGAGFIGSAVAAEITRRGDTALVVDRNKDILVDELPEGESVIHLAGVLGTAELFDEFDRAVDVNVKGTQRVLEHCRRTGANYVGITMPQVWANVYQATKGCARALATAWHESFGVGVSHVCAYNAFGPGQRFGPGHPQKIIPTFSTHAWRGEPIPIWGTGEQTVDLLDVAQIARVLVDATGFRDNASVEAGSGTELTVNAVARVVLDVTGSTAGVTHLPMRAGERPGTRLCASGLGWDRLTWRPHLDAVALAETIESYKPS
jgi:UDP-glucose 4-epimerase